MQPGIQPPAEIASHDVDNVNMPRSGKSHRKRTGKRKGKGKRKDEALLKQPATGQAGDWAESNGGNRQLETPEEQIEGYFDPDLSRRLRGLLDSLHMTGDSQGPTS